MLSNARDEFDTVSGDVWYGNIGPREAQQFRSQIVMNTEDDVHFPTLKVSETMNFASSTKVPNTRPTGLEKSSAHIAHETNAILESLSIAHTSETVVGNEFVRGVSGGERKRVSLAEVLATQAPVQCWDNSTRGLDASNALDFTKLLRRAADEQQKTVLATLYQAGNGIFNQFDKVLVLAEGKQIYYGPSSLARAYFEDMGFICAPGANIADYLTSVSVPTERQIASGFEGKTPETAEDFAIRYRESSLHRLMKEEELPLTDHALAQEVEDLVETRNSDRNRSMPLISREASPYQVSLGRQILACTKRQFQVIWGDRFTSMLNISSSLIMALVTASLFYNLLNDSTSIFPRPGALFFPILLFGLNAMSEVQASFLGRPIVSRHKRLAFSRPSAYAIANMLTDIPLALITLSLFEIIYYFMVGFQFDAGKFFTQWVILLAIVLCFLSFFRMVGSWCHHFGMASQIAGVAFMGKSDHIPRGGIELTMILALMIYAGYLIPFPSMHVWFRWIAWINPATYCLQALLASEMGDRQLECVEPQYVPYGTSYTNDSYRACTVPGSVPGLNIIDGESYINDQYSSSSGDIWRNFGIIVAFWVFFGFMAAMGFEVQLSVGKGSKVLFDRRSREKELDAAKDPEKLSQHGSAADERANTEEESSAGQTIFTFEDIDYFVRHEGKEKQLLQKVSGYVKPGQLVALMGSSGAGKTTLMDVLAQRKDSGRIGGSIMVSVRAQPRRLCLLLTKRSRSMESLKGSASRGLRGTANRTMFTNQTRPFSSHSYSPQHCDKVTKSLSRRKSIMCTASWIFSN